MKKIIYQLLFITTIVFGGCTKFLDINPSNKLSIPETGDDLIALMNDAAIMNFNFGAGLGEVASDNVYVQSDRWMTISNQEHRESYVWTKGNIAKQYWNTIYKKISTANVVLDYIDKVNYRSKGQRDELLGIAKFMRAYAYFDIVQNFARSYDLSHLQDLGIVLREDSDVNTKSHRSTLGETYHQIISDYKSAVLLLPENKPQYPTRPYKASAYAALARTYLVMKEYGHARLYADSCLALKKEILDYTTITTKAYPFQKFNEEVLFYSQMAGYGILSESVCRVDSNLYELYLNGDHRKRLFFLNKPDGNFSFVGDYAGQSNVNKFSGLTTSEMILTLTECLVRLDDLDKSKSTIYNFLNFRYAPEDLPEIWHMSKERFLRFVLEERRKELVFRGLRWLDMRRLSSKDGGFTTLERVMEDKIYRITKEELDKFAFSIPQEVIELSGIPQN